MPRDPPIVLDIDGTLTRPAGWGIDPRLIQPLYEWDGPVVIATGKAFPYPVALCHFIAIPELVIAENGGVVYTGETVEYAGDPAAARAVAAAYRDAGYALGWGDTETVNRWRETEIAVSRDQPLAPLQAIASEHGLEVLDTGYAYHVVSPDTSKGRGLEVLLESIGPDHNAAFDPADAVAVGDSENDVSTFDLVGRSFAVANADDAAKRAAGTVLEEAHADGTLAVLEQVKGSVL